MVLPRAIEPLQGVLTVMPVGVDLRHLVLEAGVVGLHRAQEPVGFGAAAQGVEGHRPPDRLPALGGLGVQLGEGILGAALAQQDQAQARVHAVGIGAELEQAPVDRFGLRSVAIEPQRGREAPVGVDRERVALDAAPREALGVIEAAAADGQVDRDPERVGIVGLELQGRPDLALTADEVVVEEADVGERDVRIRQLQMELDRAVRGSRDVAADRGEGVILAAAAAAAEHQHVAFGAGERCPRQGEVRVEGERAVEQLARLG